MPDKLQKQKGFTLIELLVVISIIGILSAATYSLINIGTQKAKAEDSKKRVNIAKLADILEAYCLTEGICPQAAIDQNPLAGTDANKLREYITRWPDDDGATYYYRRFDQNFVVYVAKSADPSRYLKYSSVWRDIRECGAGNGNQIFLLEMCPN